MRAGAPSGAGLGHNGSGVLSSLSLPPPTSSSAEPSGSLFRTDQHLAVDTIGISARSQPPPASGLRRLLPGGCSSLLLGLPSSTLPPTDRSVQTDSGVSFPAQNPAMAPRVLGARAKVFPEAPKAPRGLPSPPLSGLVPHPSSPSSSAPATLAILLLPGSRLPSHRPAFALAGPSAVKALLPGPCRGRSLTPLVLWVQMLPSLGFSDLK